MRQKIAEVESEMHKIEIWRRDNYVQKPELNDLRRDIKEFAADIKKDVRELSAKMDKH